MQRERWISAPVLIGLLFFGAASEGRASDLFERDGFRIRYVSTGGNCVGCEWIAVDGVIPPDAGVLLDDYVRQLGFVPNVVLDSQGGSLTGAMQLGRSIRDLGLDTAVGETVPEGDYHTYRSGRCYSACAYAFLGGLTRLAQPGEIGVNQNAIGSSSDNAAVDRSAQQMATARLLDYVLEMGADARIVAEAYRTPPDRITILSQQQLAEFGVAYDPKQYGAWRLEPHQGAVVARSETRDGRTTMTFLCRQSVGPELSIAYGGADDRSLLEDVHHAIDAYELLGNRIMRSETVLARDDDRLSLRVPLSDDHVGSLQTGDRAGAFAVHRNEARVYQLIHEQINPHGLADSVRIVLRHCID